MQRDRARVMNLAGLSGRPWYRIENNVDAAELFIYDEISFYGVTADDFQKDLRAITAKHMTVHIHSPGGDVFDGLAIYNAIRSHPSYVTTRVDALAGSIASVIAQAGDHRSIVQRGQMMIHEASGVMGGNAAEMAAFAELLDKQSALIADIYADRAGDVKRSDEFRDLMRAETWLSDQETVALGLADELVKPPVKEAPTNSIAHTPQTTTADWSLLLAAAEARSLEALR